MDMEPPPVTVLGYSIGRWGDSCLDLYVLYLDAGPPLGRGVVVRAFGTGLAEDSYVDLDKFVEDQARQAVLEYYMEQGELEGYELCNGDT